VVPSYPIKDRVAIVGVGSTGFSRDAGGRSELSLAAHASIAAIRDAGLGLADIDGVCGTSVPAARMVATLGLPNVTWYDNAVAPGAGRVQVTWQRDACHAHRRGAVAASIGGGSDGRDAG
jgi:hypothetical protein